METKVVLITGASGGIGSALAEAFGAEGARLVLNYRNRMPEELIDGLRGKGVDCITVQADVGDYAQAEELINKTLEQYGRLDVLVNNAGITRDNLLIRMSEREFDEVLAVNLKGTFNTTKQAAVQMLKQRSGCIINMSSISGVYGNAGQANYAASKAGVIGFTKATAKELASRNITCNAIAPGFIETEMTDRLSDAVKNKALESIGLKRFGRPEEVAKAAVFLAENNYITGQVIQVDGGLTL